MRTIKTLLVIAIAIAFTSCQKENSNDTGSPAKSSKVKTYTEDVVSNGTQNSMTFNLAYNTDNKIISMTSAASSGDRFEYHYAAGTYSLELYNSNKLSLHQDFFLNSIPAIDSSFQYDNDGYSSSAKYLYNAAKQLITIKEYESAGTGYELSNIQHYTYDSRGNVIKIADDNSVTTYEYYPNLVNNLVFGLPYGPVSKDLVKTTTYFDGSTLKANHVYTFDDANRISTEKATTDDGDSVTKTYTYY